MLHVACNGQNQSSNTAPYMPKLMFFLVITNLLKFATPKIFTSYIQRYSFFLSFSVSIGITTFNPL